jgi:hypothetical protein
MSCTNEDIELRAMDLASTAYHDHQSHPSDCLVYEEHARDMGRTNTSCPCEDNWRDFMDQLRREFKKR